MEDLRLSSRRAADRGGPAGGGGRSGYDDVFGGPPRYNSGPFAARMTDYAEVFGGLSSACSIPVLDLPSALDGYGDAPADGLDYGEIFGGGGGDFAFSYEELLAERDGLERGMEVPASTERAPKEAEFGEHVTEVLEFSPDGTDGDNMMFVEEDQVPYDSLHLNDRSRKLNTSHYKISRENMEETVTDIVHETQLRAVPGFSIDVAENSSLKNLRTDSPSSMVDNDLGHNAGSNGRVSEWKQEKASLSSSSNASAKIPRNNNIIDQGSATKSSTSEDDPASLKHHSRSPSSQSASSGDTYYSDFSYLTVSDISLRTQPVGVPPPSRRPPKLVNNQEIPRTKVYANPKAVLDEGSKPVVNHQKQGGQDAPKRRAPHVSMRDSSRFYDVEVDASSAAAASAAAMKEAMEQAQARLKSAKELMERKQDIFQSRKKQGQKDRTRSNDENDDRDAQEIKIFNKVTTQKTLVEDKKKNEFVLPESQKTRVAAKVAPDHEEKGNHILSDKHGQQFVEGNESRSSQASLKMTEKSGEWKTDKQFFELVHNENIFQLVKELPDQEYVEKIPKGNTKVNKNRTDESHEADVVYEFEMNSEVNGTHEMEEYTKKSKIDNVIYKVEKINELPRTIPYAFVQEENVNKVEKICDSHQPVSGEKQGHDLDAHVDKGDVKKSNTGKESSACGERERKLKPAVNVCEFEVVHENEDNSKNLECSIDKCGYEAITELGQTKERYQPFETETNLEVTNETCMQDEDDKRIMMSHSSFMWEAGEELKTSQELNQPENLKDTLECCQEGFENNLNATNLASKQEEDKIPVIIKEAPVFVENELKLKVTQEPIKMDKNPEKLKTDREVIGCGENEKMGSVTEVCWQDYNEKNTQEGQMKLQQTEEKQNETQVPCELEKSEDLTVAVRLNAKNESENIKEVHVSGDLIKNHKIFNVAREVFQMAVNKDLEDIQEVTLSEKKRNILNLAPNTKEGYQNMLTENITCSVQKIEETENDRQIEVENEREKEQELKEEKMREKERKLQAMERKREREKDKIAVERATREAHEWAFVEARERAERIAVERVTAEARQRALAESREKAEKSSAEALEKSLAEKASRDARLRAERAAVERATAEARERAVERAIAEKAAANARENAEKLNATSFRDKTRRGIEMEDHFRASDRGNNETRDFTQNMEFRKVDSSGGGQKHLDSYNQGEGESALRCKARLERHQRTVQRAAKALAEKNMRDILAQREQAERNRLADTLDADVRRWCSGKEGNLRALLSTLQYILGPDSGWQPIPLTEVITAAAVKKAYRRATLCVHPDKLQQRGASIQQKYTCEKVFDLLKDAWNRFNSEER